MASRLESLCVHPSVKWAPLNSLLISLWVKPAPLKTEQDLKLTFWKVVSDLGNKIWSCMKCSLRESWYDEGQKAKCGFIWWTKEILTCPSFKLYSKGYGPASDTGEHDCKIPLLFLDVNITEPPPLLRFHQWNSCWPWQEQFCTLPRPALNCLSLIYLFLFHCIGGQIST